MVNESSNGAPELVAALNLLRAEHAKRAAITADFARAIDELERILAYMEDAPPERDNTIPPPIGPSLVPATAPLFPPAPPTRLADAGWSRRLRGLTQRQALVRIAQDNGGVIRTTDVRDIFIRVGLAKGNPRNVNGHVHHILTQSDSFERVSPGTFRLVTPELPELPPRIVNGTPPIEAYPPDEMLDNS